MIRVEGFTDSVSYRTERLRGLLARHSEPSTEIREGSHGTDPGWRWVRDAEGLADFGGDVWRFSVKPGDASRVVRVIERAIGDADRCRFQLDWGGGLIWVGCPPGTDLRLHGVNGHATLVRASAETYARLGAFQPESPPLAAMAERLRQQFDPRGILNPGLMG